MKTKKQIAIEQINLQHAMQFAGFNLVTCGNCGALLIHKTNDEKHIDCFCGRKMELSDCPDYWYEGCEENEEFKMKDLFEDYKNIPDDLQKILDKQYKKFGFDLAAMNYKDVAKMKKEVESIGYTFESHLDNIPFGLRPIGIELNQLEGWEND